MGKLLLIKMIGSAVGYAGFKSYGDLAYPNLKAGE